MNYAKETLQKELTLLNRCLSDWKSSDYPEAKKRLTNKIKDINNTLELL